MEDKELIWETPAQKEGVILKMESLETNPGWQLIVKIVKANIFLLEKQLREGTEGQTMDDIKRLREKIKDHYNFIETPERLKKDLAAEGIAAPNPDPFDS